MVLGSVSCGDADFKFTQREHDNLETFFKNKIEPKNEKCPTFQCGKNPETFDNRVLCYRYDIDNPFSVDFKDCGGFLKTSDADFFGRHREDPGRKNLFCSH